MMLEMLHDDLTYVLVCYNSSWLFLPLTNHFNEHQHPARTAEIRIKQSNKKYRFLPYNFAMLQTALT